MPVLCLCLTASLYTIGMFDIADDDESEGRSSKAEPYCHWLRINVEGLDVWNTGTDVQPFFQTVVTAEHLILLFRQIDSAPITVEVGDYNSDPNNNCFPVVL